MVYTIDEIKARITPVAEKYGIPAVYLFGSYARGTATEDSDVDLLIDMTGVKLTGMFAFGGVYNDFEEALEKEIDLVTVDTLERPCHRETDICFRNQVNRDRRQIYATA